jgi:hypothetical protein
LTATTVTATQAGNTANGLALRVKVLTGAADLQNGATAALISQAAVSCQTAITTTVTGSRVYGALMKGANGSFTANGSTTLLDNIADAVQGNRYGTCKAAADTGTPGSITIGASATSTADFSNVALAEILPAGTLAEDASSPAVASTTSATAVTTASFDPPPGALLVAMVSSDGDAGGGVTMGVSGAGATWSELAAADPGVSAGAGYAGVWVAVVPTPPAGDPVITATQGGTSANKGMYLRLLVLTGAVEGGGASAGAASASGATVPQASLTPNGTNSLPVFAISQDSATAMGAAAASNTYDSTTHDTTDNWSSAQGHYTGTVTQGTPVTVGAGAIGTGAPDHGNWAVYEVRSAGGATPSIDASTPVLASTEALATVSTVFFNPPAGAVLVALITGGGLGSGSGMTMTVSGGGLTWTQRVTSSASDTFQPCFIFTTTVPAVDSGRVVHFPPDFLFELIEARQRWYTTDVVPPAPAAAVPPPGMRPAVPSRPLRRAALGARGALAAGILATGIGPPAVRAPHQPPAIGHPAPHRAQWDGSAPGTAPNAAPQKRYPVTIFPRAAHRALWRGITGSPPNAAQQVKRPLTVFARKPHGALWDSVAGVPPAAQPQPFRPATVYVRAPHRALWRGGAGTAVAAVQGGGAPQPFKPLTVWSRKPHGASWRAGRGSPPAALAQPSRPLTVFTRPQHRALWRGAAGTAVTVTPGTGPPQPTRPVTVFRRVAHAAIWRAAAGAPPAATRQPFRPATVFTRVPHRASWQQARGVPPAARKQPFRPVTVYARRLRGAIWRSITGVPPVFVPPPPFTVGQLTAQTAATGALTAGAAPGGSGYGALYGPAYPGGAGVTLTAGDRPAGTLAGGTAPGSTGTTGTQRTGGPG